MNGKLKFGSAFAAVFAIGVLLGFVLMQPTPMIGASGQVRWSGAVHVQIIRNGEVIYDYDTHNIIVTDGSTWVRDFLKSGTTGATNATDDVAVGNHTTFSASDTKLATECTTANLTRTSGTVSIVNATAYQVLYERIASDTVTVNATSLHHDPTSNTSGNMVAAASITTASLISGDTLRVTWTVNIPAG
jgi:ABC-type proline/glycine betaine transport system ATPase subunit